MKSWITMALLALTLPLRAQHTNITPPTAILVPLGTTGFPSLAGQTETGFWGNSITELDLNNLFTISNASLFPDSTVLQAYVVGSTGGKPTLQLGYTSLHAVGEVIDPKYASSPVQVSRFTRCTLDSFALYYRYFRGQHSTDTLLVQVYDNSQVQRYVITNSEGTPTGICALTALNPATGLPAASAQTFRYLLEDKDTSATFRRLAFASGLSIPANGLAAVVITFLPGYSYQPGDTLQHDWNPKPKKVLNNFVAGMYADASSQVLDTYNNGLLLATPARYNPVLYQSRMLAGNVLKEASRYLTLDFHLTLLNAGTTGPEHTAAQCYPNPLLPGDELHMHWPYPAASAHVDVYTINGELAHSRTVFLEKGENALPSIAVALKPGIYQLHIRSAEKWLQQRLLVQ